jgi:SpoVK/Ycf46/Vps4 family AAA+-type ATPase
VVLKPLPESRDETTLSWPHLAEKMDLVERLLASAVSQEERGINILLYGAPGTGKTEFAHALVRKLGVKGYQIADTGDDQSPASRQERLASLVLSQTFAPAKESVLVLDEAEDIFDTDYNSKHMFRSAKAEPSKSWMNALLEKTRVPVIWISNRIGHMDPAYLRRFSYCLEFPAMPKQVRRHIAQAYLEPAGVSSATIESLLGSEHVSPALLSSATRVISLAKNKSPSVTPDAVARLVLTDNLKAMGHEFYKSVPQRATRFDLAYLNVKGAVTPEAVLNGLQRMGRGTMLLAGAPGTGKTQFAAEIANRLGRELVYKTASDINSMWYGQSERNVAEMFTDCDPAKEVLFLDEADTLLGAREASGHRADKAVTAEFLRRVEAFEGIFVCATNHGKDFDSAMMRRFVYRLTFLPLDTTQRTNLFLECAMGWNPEGGVTAPELEPALLVVLGELDQLTAGDFANVVKRVKALQLELSPLAWLEELRSEQEAKPQKSGNRIGFV